MRVTGRGVSRESYKMRDNRAGMPEFPDFHGSTEPAICPNFYAFPGGFPASLCILKLPRNPSVIQDAWILNGISHDSVFTAFALSGQLNKAYCS